MPMQPRPRAETSSAPNFRCFNAAFSMLRQSYPHRLPLSTGCGRWARGGDRVATRAWRRGGRLSVALGTWVAPGRGACNLRADDGRLAGPGGIGELLNDERGGIGARDLRDAVQLEVLAGADAAGARAVGEPGGIDEGPIEAAAADEVVGDGFVRVDVPQCGAEEDFCQERRFVERLAHAKGRSDDQPPHAFALHGGEDDVHGARHELLGAQGVAAAESADDGVLSADGVGHRLAVDGDVAVLGAAERGDVVALRLLHDRPPQTARCAEEEDVHVVAVSKTTRTSRGSAAWKLSFSNPMTRPRSSFIRTTSSPVSSTTVSRRGSSNQTVRVLPSGS